MFSFLRRAQQAIAEAKTVESNNRMFVFDAAEIVQAITFHLLDEGKARAVDLESSTKAVQRLAQQIDRLTISANQWAAMENLQRLQWLLNQSHIVVRPTSSGAAELLVRR